MKTSTRLLMSIFSATLFLFSSIASFAQSDAVIHAIDSCRNILPAQSAEERLATWQQMRRLVFMTGLDLELQILQEMQQEYMAQNHYDGAGLAIYLQMAALHNYNEIDRMVDETDNAMHECKRIGAMGSCYRLANMKGENLLLQNKPQTALRFITPIFEEARQTDNYAGIASCSDCFGQIYTAMGDYTQAETYFQEAINYFEKCGPSAYNSLMTTYFKRCNNYFSSEPPRNQEAFDVALQYEKLLDSLDPADYPELNITGHRRLCYFLKGTAAYELDLGEVVLECYKLMLYYGDNRGGKSALTQTLQIYDLATKGDYAEAIAITQELIDLYIEVNMELSSAVYYQIQARIQNQTGDYEAAYNTLQDYVKLLTKARNNETLMQQNEFSAIYELEKKESQKKLLRSWLTGLIISSLLLIGGLALVLFYSRKLRRRNLDLCRQIEANQLSRQRLEMLHKEVSNQNQEQPKVCSLIDELEKLMITERLFTRSELTREELAARLGTNRTKLGSAIKETYNQSYSEYITSLRLNEAVALLDKQRDMDMQLVAENSGYGTYSSFYRAFLKQYGVKPTDYVRFLKEKT